MVIAHKDFRNHGGESSGYLQRKSVKKAMSHIVKCVICGTKVEIADDKKSAVCSQACMIIWYDRVYKDMKKQGKGK